MDETRGRTIEVVGQLRFKGAAERGELTITANLAYLKEVPLKPGDFRIFLDDEEISADELRKIMDGSADYIVFENTGAVISRFNELNQIGLQGRFITTANLLKYAAKNFFSIENNKLLMNILREHKICRLLDADDLIASNNLFYAYLDTALKLATVDENSFAKKFPVVENFCSEIYPSLDDCRFKTYDAILIAERSPEDFIDLLIDTDSLSENILLFARKNSALENWLAHNENIFDKVSRFPAINGNHYLLKKRVAKDFCVYVVTHKDVKLDALPEGYRIIHAGHAVAKEDFGYLGDDTGDNISTLNRYLNEITALYWMWKNTSHAIIGLNHYRRFFTAAEDKSFAVEKILSREAAENILRDYDVIVVSPEAFLFTQHELKYLICGDDLNGFVENVFREHIRRKQSDYLEAFDYVSSSYFEFMYEMFLTRRKVFDAYCEWLFSFIIDVTEEILSRTNIAQVDNPRKYRVIGLIAERLLTVWLMKNRLKIKRLPVMFRKGI